MDAITLLRDDHKLLRDLTRQLAETTERAVETRPQLLHRIEVLLAAHTAIEEELFYPAYVAAADDVEAERKVAEGIEEHRACDHKVIPDLHRLDPSTVQWSGDAKVLKDYIFHHLGEEEEEMFPQMRELLGRKELEELGEKMMTRKKELIAKAEAKGAAKAGAKP